MWIFAVIDLLVFLLFLTGIIVFMRKTDEYKQTIADQQWKKLRKLVLIVIVALFIMTLAVTLVLQLAFNFSPFVYLWGFWVFVILSNVCIFIGSLVYENRKKVEKSKDN